MQIDGKKVLITGAARRIGALIARRLAGKGAVICLHCHRSVIEGETLVEELPGRGHRLLAADLAVPGEAARLWGECGGADILINNASVYARTPADLPEEEARRYFEVNFWSPLALMRCFASPERTSPGVVINILDAEVLRPAAQNGIYALSRKALADATAAFALEQAPRNLRFAAVAPGPMLPPAGMENSAMSKVLKSVPSGRRTEPEDLVSAILFIIGCDSLTGAVIPVDGGQHLKNHADL